MEFNLQEKRTIGDAIFIALANLMVTNKSKADTIALWGLILRNYVYRHRLPKQVNLQEKDVLRQVLNLLFLFMENTYIKIREKGQVPEAFTTIKYTYAVLAKLDNEGTTVPAETIKISVTPKMIKDVNALISKLGHEA